MSSLSETRFENWIRALYFNYRTKVRQARREVERDIAMNSGVLTNEDMYYEWMRLESAFNITSEIFARFKEALREEKREEAYAPKRKEKPKRVSSHKEARAKASGSGRRTGKPVRARKGPKA